MVDSIVTAASRQHVRRELGWPRTGMWRAVGATDLSWLKLVPRWPADLVERCADVFGYGLFCGEGVVAGVDLDGAVAAEGLDESADGPAGEVLDALGHGEGGEHDGEVGVDGFPFPGIDRAGFQVVFGHPEGVLDVPQLVVGVNHELYAWASRLVTYGFQPARARTLASRSVLSVRYRRCG